MNDRPVKHSVTLKGHRTSVSLEPEFWQAFRRIAAEKSVPINALVAQIDVERGTRAGLASAIRLHVLRDLQARLAADEDRSAPE
ncbi:ribbon-helix-helix domain-containing protein [uncultured Roseobacter sp.]|uniref:ribbon-helix-helix domain-containing protein n=1 Tax=uncultured Roseobacter sp. TaxID=114847 RepID=UPI00260FF622|nr:ribbon-helix-helix domain-containing protein [uncultured Roseobacter sp.]